jgi:hypothetical protein
MKVQKRHVILVLNAGFWVLTAVLAFNLGRNLVGRHKVSAQAGTASSKVIPFTAVLKDVTYDETSHPVFTSMQTWAARSDGSAAIQLEQNLPGNRPSGSRHVEFRSGERLSLNLFGGEKSTTYYAPESSTIWIRTPLSNCLDNLKGEPITANQVFGGNETVDGYQTVKITLANVTWWFAPAYGCAPIRIVAEFASNRRVEQRLVSLQQGEPSATLFSAPDSYQEVSAATLLRNASGSEDCQKDNAKCGVPSGTLQRMDDEYYAHRNPR